MKSMIRERNRFVAAAVGTMLFGAIYECFSHQVYSLFMIFAFLFPLLGGAIPWGVLLRVPRQKCPGMLSRCLYSSGIAALTAGNLFQGVLEIYGTTGRLSSVYWVTGAVFMLAGLLCYATDLKGQRI